MKLDEVFILEDRGLLYVNGENAKSFLQNLVTNNMEDISDRKSIFAALLTPQGKYLCDFIIYKHKSGYFLDCEKDLIEDLYKQLCLYKLRSKIEILNLSNEFVIAALSKEKFLEIEGSEDLNGYTIKFREDTIALDPRESQLGARLIINLEKLYLSLKKLKLKNSNIEKYYSHSHELGIAQKNNKYLQNKLFGIECNFDELNGIDFKKGCYVGQENTARIKLKNKLNKRLFALKVEEGKIDNDTIYFEGKEIGKILITDKNLFGVIKINHENFKLDNLLECGSSKVRIIKPNWM